MSANNGAPGPLDEFWRFVKDFQNVYANIAKLAVAVPLIDLILRIGPPWPSRIGVGFAVVMLEILVLMISFAMWRQGRTRLSVIKKWLVGSAAGFGLVFVLLYLPLMNFIVRGYETAGNDGQPVRRDFVIGMRAHLDPIKEKVLESQNQPYNPKWLLDTFVDAKRDETSIWTMEGIALMRSVILATWLIATTLYAVSVSAFLALQYRRL